MTTRDPQTDDPWKAQLEALGSFIRAQRGLADLSLRQLSDRTNISNAYLSQLERGRHQPSMRVLSSIAAALGMSAEALLAQVRQSQAPTGEPAPAQPAAPSLEDAIRADPYLTKTQQEALVNVYRAFRAARPRRST